MTPWRDSRGEVGGLIISAHDITDMVEALDRLERSEERLKLAMEIADVHVWEMDYVRRRLIKTGAEETFFTEPKTYRELLADPWAPIDPRDRPAAMELWERHLRDGQNYRPEHRVARPDGKEVWALSSVRLFTDEAGAVVRVVGAMPNALAIKGQTLYACNGGDNAIAEIDLATGTVRGFRHAGYFPCAIQLSHDGSQAYVLNSKGNGSVENTIHGNPVSPHDFQGTITVVDLSRDLAQETAAVAKNNYWESLAHPRPDHPVYRGAIKHVLSGVNPQGCEVTSFKSPSAEELDHDYLWRCAKRLP